MRRRDIPELATANFIFEVVDRILLPYQIEWMHCDDPIAFFEKSRRIGITWATAAKAVEKAATPKADGGSDVYYIGSDESLGKEFIGDCTEWAEAYNLILEEQEEIEQYDAGTGEWETVEAGALIDLEDDTKAKALSLKFESREQDPGAHQQRQHVARSRGLDHPGRSGFPQARRARRFHEGGYAYHRSAVGRCS